jgi:hypothetical protein
MQAMKQAASMPQPPGGPPGMVGNALSAANMQAQKAGLPQAPQGGMLSAMGAAQPMGGAPPQMAQAAQMQAMKQAASMPQPPMPMAGGPQPPGMGGTASMGALQPMGGFNQAPAQPMGGGMQSMGALGGPMPPGAQQNIDSMMQARNAANAPVTPAAAGMAGKVMPGAPIGRAQAMKKGGEVKLAKGGSVGGRGDGIAQRGKTRGTMR